MGASLSNKTRSRGRRTGGQYKPMAEINVTPMVDVMLVLLIIFMVAAPLLTQGVDISLPKNNAKPIKTQDNKPIEITVNKDGKIFIGEKTEVKESMLQSILSSMLEGRDDATIYFRGDKDLNYEKANDILTIIGKSGTARLALVSDPE